MVGAGLGPLAMGMSYDRTSSYKLMLECFAVALAVASLPVLRLGTYAYPSAQKAGRGECHDLRSLKRFFSLAVEEGTAASHFCNVSSEGATGLRST
jgi:hypothetical protein